MNASSHPKHENTLKIPSSPASLRSLWGRQGPRASRNGRAPDAIVPNMVCMRGPQTDDFTRNFLEKPNWDRRGAPFGAAAV